MSAGIMPDVYRHTARKSTVSKLIKSSNMPACSAPAATYATYNHGSETTVFGAVHCAIKMEADVSPAAPKSFVIVPDNETEQVPVGKGRAQRTADVVSDVIEQLLSQTVRLVADPSPESAAQIPRTMSRDTQEAHDALASILIQCDENENNDDIRTVADVNKTVDEPMPMECEEQVSVASRSHMDDDIVEIEAESTEHHSHSCICQCHTPTSSSNSEYLLFEQALRQTRQEQQQERLLSSNRLIQTLKRQHEELLGLYQQNKTQKSPTSTKIDREQQTVKLSTHDSQMQTDGTPTNNSKASSHQPKPVAIPAIKTQAIDSFISQTPTSTYNGVFSSISSSTSSVLPQLAPRLPSSASSTSTTVTSKKSTVTTKTAVMSNGFSIIPTLAPPTLPTASSTASHDIVDLTEEDEDDTNRRPLAQRIVPIRQSTSSTHLPTPAATTATAVTTTTTTTTTTAPTATRLRAVNRPARLNNTNTAAATNGQAFPLRPLPEHAPLDHTIARPQLSITQENATVRLTWNLPLTPMESIQTYEIYAYKQNASLTNSDWKKIGTVKSMRLPMAVTLKEFQSNSHYAFAVRAISVTNNIGPFCEPKTIFTGNTPVQPLHTSQLLNVPT